MPLHSRFLTLLAATVVLSGDVSALAQDGNEQAEMRLRRLTEQVTAASGDKEKLRAELLAFVSAHGGTRYAARTGALLMQLPSPIDRLDPANIPAIERFAWQPKELVAVLGEHLGRHGNPLTCVAYAPDGKMIASGGGPYVRLWNAQTMRLKHLFGPGYYVMCVAFSRDGKMLAAGTNAGILYVWDLQADDKPPVARTTLPAASTAINAVAFAPNGRTVACACGDNATRLYNVTDKKLKDQAVMTGHTGPVNALAYSPDGKILATGSADQSIRLWNATTEIPGERSVLKGVPSAVQALAFNPAGTTLAAGCADGKLLLYTMPAGTKPRATFEAKNTGSVNAVTFSATGNTLAAACADSTIRLWNVTLARPVERFKLAGHVGACKSVAYSPDSRILASGGDDWVCRTWELNATPRPRERFVPAGHLGYVYSSAFLPDCTALASGSVDGIVRLWDLTRPDAKTRNYLRTDATTQIYRVAVSPDGKLVAAGGNNPTVRQWDALTGRPQHSCVNEGNTAYYLAYTPDSKQLAAAGNEQKEAVLFDVHTGRVERSTGSHEVGLNGLAISPDGKLLATCSGRHLYDKMGKIVLDKKNQYVYNDCTIKLWDLGSGAELHAIKTHTVPVYNLSFSPDGKTLLSAAYESQLRARPLADPVKSEKPSCRGSTGYGYAYGILYSPDGKYLATVGVDYRVLLWDVATDKIVWQWASNEQIASIALASDGRHLAVNLQTGVIYLVRLPTRSPQ